MKAVNDTLSTASISRLYLYAHFLEFLLTRRAIQ
jgi:hypothetical protein